jgi:hypothetical protein
MYRKEGRRYADAEVGAADDVVVAAEGWFDPAGGGDDSLGGKEELEIMML